MAGRCMVNSKLLDDYRTAMDAYEAAKAGRGDRAKAFIQFLVAERVLFVCISRMHQNLQEIRARYSP
jgi:hypothetical protein